MYSISSLPGTAEQVYPERDVATARTPDKFMAAMKGVIAPWFNPRWQNFEWIIDAVKSQADIVDAWSDETMLAESRRIARALKHDGLTMEWVGRVFAMVREIAHRTIGLRHRDVQLIGGAVMLSGMVAEMETGEGKTLTATLPACALALSGIPVHIITVNDYLVQRDTHWMKPIYEALGLSVGTVIHGMSPADRRQAYRSNVTYCTNKELAFDYLKDRIVLWDRPTALRLQIEQLFGESSRIHQLLLPGLYYAIVDEADSVLIDEARTPLIISSDSENAYDPAVYKTALEVARRLEEDSDFHISSADHTIELSKSGTVKITSFDWPEPVNNLTDKQRQELIRQALAALNLFHRDTHYLVHNDKIQIVDEYTGRLMADRSWEMGMHQLIEIKEGCMVTQQKETRARISYQRLFRRYLRLTGMTGTATEVAGELRSIYDLKVVRLPTHRPLRRTHLPNRIFTTVEKKWEAVLNCVTQHHRLGRPVLVGTRSVEASEHLSRLMNSAGLPHEVLNARQDQEEAGIIAMAGEADRITVATNMAGRGTDIRLAEGTVELGGLFVLATERHEAGRIDRQLFGRCGRQGDPGCYQAFVCLEDELITAYSSRFLRGLAAASLKVPVSLFGLYIGKLLFRLAQRKAERQHAGMRHSLLMFDEKTSESLAFTGRTE